MPPHRHAPPHDPNEPISRYEAGPSRKREPCTLCGELIEKGARRTALTLFHWLTDEPVVAHEPCFLGSAWATNWAERFVPRSYRLADFDGEYLFFDSPFREGLGSFHRAVELLVAPLDETIASSRPHALLFDVLHACGYADELVNRMRDLPIHASLFFALHDDERFQREAARLLAVPGFGAALDGLRRPRVTLKADQLADRTATPALRGALASTITAYGLDGDRGPTALGFSGFDQTRWARLVSFFLSSPADLPPLARLVQSEGHSRESRIGAYASAFYQRAAILAAALRAQDAIALASWFEELDALITYYWSGKPDAFVTTTKADVAMLLRGRGQ